MSKTFDPATDIPDLAGKTVLVTGGNAGLGAETVKAVAAHNPDNLFLCARTASKAEAFINELRKEHPNTTTKAVNLDLASFDSIKAAAKQIDGLCDKIDVLFLNAGVAALSPQLTKEGYEIQFGTNHVGHALFTQLIMPKVLAAAKQPGADARIVVVSSVAGQRCAGVPLKDLKTDLASTSTMGRYSISKLANVYFAQRLAKDYPAVNVTSMHPGTVFTEIWGKAGAIPKWLGFFLIPGVRAMGLTAADGAKNQLWCAFAKDVKTGHYYDPVGKEVPGSAPSHDVKARDELWDWTNKELAAHGAPGWPAA